MKIIFLGDSITEGAGASRPENTYVSIVEKTLGIECLNYGIGGTRFARQKELHCNCVQFNYDFNMRFEILPDADFLVCLGGTNDFGHGTAPLGEYNSENVWTFHGATNLLFRNLSNKYGKSKILIVLPLPRIDEENDKGEFFIAKPAGSPKMSVYADIIKMYAEKYGLHVADFRKQFGTPNTRNNEGLFFDGLHPNDSGHALLAKLICKEINNLIK